MVSQQFNLCTNTVKVKAMDLRKNVQTQLPQANVDAWLP
jgi:hypothetical protein